MAVRKEIVRNMKGMRKRLGHLIGYGQISKDAYEKNVVNRK